MDQTPAQPPQDRDPESASPFAKLPKPPQNPIERPNNGHRTLIIVVSLFVLAIVILAGSILYITSFVSDNL